MAKFLDTTGTSYHLEQIIKNCKAKLILISPYLRVNDRVKDLLNDLDRMKIDIRIVFGKTDLNPQEMKWIESLKSIRTFFCKNLHAKCYMNENEALITSMNLYVFSQVNNNEMGIYVTKEDDLQLYTDIENEANRLVRFGEEIRTLVEMVEEPKPKYSAKESKPNGKIVAKNKNAEDEAFCIRCGDEMKFDVNVPYCKKCYKEWKKTENENVKEEFCHNCGEEHKTKMAKPMCYECFKINKDIFE